MAEITIRLPATPANRRLAGRILWGDLSDCPLGAKRSSVIPADPEALLDVRQAAAYIGYSVSGLRKLTKAGLIIPIQLPTSRLPETRKRGGKKLRFERASLEAFRQGRTGARPTKRPPPQRKRNNRKGNLPPLDSGLSSGWGWT
jgi:hypothetical protein